MPSYEIDPLGSLRDELSEEDEPLFPAAKAAPAVLSAPVQQGSRATPAQGRSSAAPPPLPSRQKTGAHARTGSFPAVGQPQQPLAPRTNIVPPNASPAISQLQGRQAAAPLFAIPNVPPMVQRPGTQDPFNEPPEPRVPVGVDSEEKLKSFRIIVKGKDEALARGRALFQAIDLEAQQLRGIATQMRGQLELAMVEVQRAQELPQQVQTLKDMLEKDTVRADAAERKMEELVARFAEADEERKDLTNALAEVEQQYGDAAARVQDAGAHFQDLTSRYEEERRGREQVTEELVGLKEALGNAQDRVSELASRNAQAREQYEALQTQASRFAEEAQNLALEVDRLKSENENLAAELQGERGRAEGAEQKAAALSTEDEWSKSSLDQAQLRVTDLEQESGELRGIKEALEEQIAARQVELDAAEADRDALQRQVMEAQLTATRLSAELDREKREHGNRIEQLEAQVRETQTVARNQLGSLQQDLAAARGQHGSAQGRLEELEGALASRTLELETRHHDLTLFQQANEQQSSDLEVLRAELQRAKGGDHELERFKAELELAEGRAAQAEAEVAELQGTLEAVSAQSNSALEESEQLRSALEEAQAAQQQSQQRATQFEHKARTLDDVRSRAEHHSTETRGQLTELAERVRGAEAKSKEQADRAKAAETRAAQNEARASQAEARLREASLKVNAGAASDLRLRQAETRVAELEQRIDSYGAVEQELRSMQAQEINLKSRIAELEDHDAPTASNVMPGPSLAELETLKGENANLKKKLMAAESAMEAAASLRSKVAKLEAQLKGKK